MGIKNDAAAQAAARAAAARRLADLADLAARKPAAAPTVARASAPTRTLPKDEVSTGQGGALRRAATDQLASTGLSSATAAPRSTAPTFKASALLNNPKAASDALDHSYDDIEDVRARRAQQAALDAATKDLPADKAQQVQAAAKAVTDASNGSNDPGERAEATARTIEAQSAQFKGDPAAAKAFAVAIASQVQALGSDLGKAITPPLQGDADSHTRPALQALANASDNLGPGASLSLGHFLANGLPDAGDLNNLDDALRDSSGSEGGRALMFGVAHGLEAQGKDSARRCLDDGLRDAVRDVLPGELFTPVDPSDPDAAGKAELLLAESKYVTGSGDPRENYANCLKFQLDALKANPAARQEVAQSQLKDIQELVQRNDPNSWQMAAALDAAQAAGPDALKTVCDQFTRNIGQTHNDLSELARQVSPETATALAFALAPVNPEMGATFAGRAADVLTGVATAAKDANDKVAELQSKLNKELAAVGPGLTDAQRHDYEARFWDQHHDAIDQQKAASAALKSALSSDLGQLSQLASSNPQAAQAISSGLKELARDPDQAQYVQSTVTGLRQADGAFPAGFQEAEKTLVEADTVATGTLANQALAAGDAAGAAAQLNQLHQFLSSTTFGSQEVRDVVSKTLPALKQFADVVTAAVKSGDLSSIADFLKDQGRVQGLNDASNASGDLGRLLGEVTQSVGTAAYLTEVAKTPDAKHQVLSILNAGNSSAGMLAKGFGVFAEATEEATNRVLQQGGAALGQLSETLGRVLPVVNLGISVVGDAMAIADAINNPSVRTIGSAVGNTMVAVGAAVAMFPGGQLIGGGLAIAGSAVGIVSGFVQGIFDDNDRKDEERSLLEGVYGQAAKDPGSPLYGLDDQQVHDAADRISHAGADLTALAKDAQLTPDQLVRMATATPAMSEGLFGPMNDIARLGSRKGQAFVDWVTSQGDGLEQKLVDWGMGDNRLSASTIAGSEANSYATSQAAQGQDYAQAYQSKYQEAYDRALADSLRGLGLLP